LADQDQFALLAELAAKDPVFGLLRAGPSFAPVYGVDPTIETLVRYFAGALADADARDVELSLTKSAEGRGVARNTHRQLSRLQSMPIAEVRSVAASDDSVSATARAWMTLTNEHLDALRGDAAEFDIETDIDAILLNEPDGRSVDIWSIIAAMRQRGKRRARSLEVSLRGIARQVRYAIQRTGPALVRGGMQARLRLHGAIETAVEAVADLECEIERCFIDASGTLLCDIQLRGGDRRALTTCDDCSAELLLVSGGMHVTIGTSIVENGRADWAVAAIGELVGIFDAPFPTKYLSVSISPQNAETPLEPPEQVRNDLLARNAPIASLQGRDTDRTVRITQYAPVLDESGLETEAVPAEVTVASMAWEDGGLLLALTLPLVTRAAFPDHVVNIDLAAGLELFQRLDMRPVSSFRDWATVLRIPFPDVIKPDVLPIEWLRFSLAPQLTDNSPLM